MQSPADSVLATPSLVGAYSDRQCSTSNYVVSAISGFDIRLSSGFLVTLLARGGEYLVLLLGSLSQ